LKWIFSALLSSLLAASLYADERYTPTILDVKINDILYPTLVLNRTKADICIPIAAVPVVVPEALPETAVSEQNGQRCFSVTALPGASVSFDEKALLANVNLPSRYLKPNTFDAGNATFPAPEASAGFYTDYSLLYQKDDNTYLYGAGLNANLFTPYGVLNSGYSFNGNETDTESVRLDTVYFLDLPASMQTLKVGDTIGGVTAMSGGFRMGGIQIARNFATRPDMITMPLPAYTSDAALPSSVDAFVNGTKIFHEAVPPGPFDISNIPTVSGSGELTVVVKDMYGVQQVETLPFYAETSLLAEGLSDYAFEMGSIRYDYGIESFDYREFVTGGSYRLGITDALTGECNALAQDEGRGRIGVGATGIVASLFTLEGDLSGSLNRGKEGYMAKAGISRRTQGYNLAARTQWGSQYYLQPGYLNATLRDQTMLFGGFSHPPFGNFSLSYVTQQYEAEERIQLFSFSLTRSFQRSLYFNTTVSYLVEPEPSTNVSVTLSLPLDERTNLSNTAAYQNDQISSRLTLQQNLPMNEGYGYRLSGAYADAPTNRFSGDAEGTYQNNYAQFGAGVSNANGMNAYRTTLNGSVTVMDGRIRLNRKVYDAFGSVDVGDIEGVRVYAQNTLIGRTDADGYVFIPSLLPYQQNKISIDPRDIPMDYTVKRTTVDLTPYRSSGLGYVFDVKRTTSVIMYLYDPHGKAVLYGAPLHIDGTKESIVGKNGMVYLEGIEPGLHRLTAETEKGSCQAAFTVTKANAETFMTDLGRFECKESQ